MTKQVLYFEYKWHLNRIKAIDITVPVDNQGQPTDGCSHFQVSNYKVGENNLTKDFRKNAKGIQKTIT